MMTRPEAPLIHSWGLCCSSFRGFIACCLAALSCVAVASVKADPRSTELLYYNCESELGRRDITLFANGTVRLREGLWESQELYLEELTSESLAENIRVLEEIRATEDPTLFGRLEIEGKWLDRCEIRLELAGQESLALQYSSYELPPVIASRLIHVAETLAETVRPPDNADRLSRDYEPRRGDILLTPEGFRFRVLRKTADGRGVELQGLDQPLRIFIALEEMSESFTSRVETDKP